MLRKLNIFRSGEKELIEGLKKHLSFSRHAVGYVLEMLSSPLDLSPSQLGTYKAKIIELEKEGDRLYDSMISSALKGAYPLFIAADLNVLLDDFDDILDLIYFLGMELGRGITAGVPKNSTALEIYSIALNMLKEAMRALDSLGRVLENVLKDLPKTSEEVSSIDLIEDLVDEIKNVALERLYSKSGELGVLEFTHLLEVVRTVDTIVDKIQDVSQELIRIFSALLS
jgi:predicted phosphate transport protein (TIGR00153 family)